MPSPDGAGPGHDAGLLHADGLGGDVDDRAAPTPVEVARYRQVLGHFCTGVAVITGVADETPVGFTAQSFTAVSLDPPLVSFCPMRTSTSWARIRPTGSFCANVLTHTQEALCRTFATRGAERFVGVGWRPAPATGSPLLDGVLAWIEATVEAEYDGGDHTIVVGRVVDLGAAAEGRPLLFYRGGYGSFQP